MFENSPMVKMGQGWKLPCMQYFHPVNCLALCGTQCCNACISNKHTYNTYIVFFNLSSGAGESLWCCISIKCQQRMEQSCSHRHLPHRKWSRQNQLVRYISVYISLNQTFLISKVSRYFNCRAYASVAIGIWSVSKSFLF